MHSRRKVSPSLRLVTSLYLVSFALLIRFSFALLLANDGKIKSKNGGVPISFFQKHQTSTQLFAAYRLPENQRRPTPLPKLQYKTSPPKSEPKPILVIGATGQIGRLVVKKLLELNLPVRAFVRDYELACDIFSKYIDTDETGMELVYSRRGGKNGKLLQIIEGDLAPEEASQDDDYGYEALECALQGCGTIISCAGTVRNSKLTDYFPPTKIWKKDIRQWCRDRRHPYYVNYVGTKKMMEFVKAEVKRREKKREKIEKRSSTYSSPSSDLEDDCVTIVRISDLNVALPPWSFVTVLVNLARSMVFRYQEMAEQVLIRESTNKIKTVILRPGDMIDDERDEEKINLQISAAGLLPSPALVSRTDVAELAVASALASNKANQIKSNSNEQSYSGATSNAKSQQLSLPNSLTLAVRWVGEDIYPQSQGRKVDGYKDAETCLNMLQNKGNKLRKSKRKVRPIPSSVRKGHIQGYGVYTSILLYSIMAVFGTILFHELSNIFHKLAPIVGPIVAPILKRFTRLLQKSKLC